MAISDLCEHVDEPRQEIEPQDEGDRISRGGRSGGATEQRAAAGYDSQ